jgi:zinc/manganese transport system substrate-binding protein
VLTLTAAVAALSLVPLASCSSDDADTSAPTGDCPTGPVPVVVTVDQWGDIVQQVGGDCVDVTTIITGSSADPHDYEPTPADAAKFDGADLVVMNGLDYDPWAEDAVDALDTKPAVVNGGEVVGLEEGDNPHIWYGPTYVRKVSQAVTDQLSKLSPDAATYFAERQDAWQTSLEPYDAEIDKVKATVGDKLTYGATEPVFEYMAQAVGLRDATPKGYRNAAANESEPAPADVNEFEQSLRDKMMDVLVYNTQTEGAGPEQIRSVAEGASVPIVDVTETVPPGTESFVDWQVKQLESLASALGA